MKRWAVFALLFLTTACQPATGTPTSTQLPPTVTLIPYNSPTPADLPTASPAPNHIDLPVWLSNPDASIFVILNEFDGENFVLSFYDSQTEELFKMNIKNTAGYFWTPDGQHFGLVEAHSEQLHLIRLEDGSVQRYQLNKKALDPIRLISYQSYNFAEDFYEEENPVPRALHATTNNPDHPNFRLLFREEIDQDYIFSKWYDGDLPERVVEVLNIKQVEIYLLTQGNDGIADIDIALSPQGDRIAVSQGIFADSPVQPGDRLSIYSVATGEKLAEYEGLFWQSIDWSPNGEQIVYSTLTSIYLDPDDSPVCILNLASGESRCLRSIERYFSDLDPAVMLDYQFSADGEGIYFIYNYYIEDPFQTLGGICYFVLLDGEIVCPSDPFDAELVKGPRSMYFSPDERFVAFDSSNFSRFSHDQGPLALNILGLQNSSFLHLGRLDAFLERKIHTPIETLLWRPSIQP